MCSLLLKGMCSLTWRTCAFIPWETIGEVVRVVFIDRKSKYGIHIWISGLLSHSLSLSQVLIKFILSVGEDIQRWFSPLTFEIVAPSLTLRGSTSTLLGFGSLRINLGAKKSKFWVFLARMSCLRSLMNPFYDLCW